MPVLPARRPALPAERRWMQTSSPQPATSARRHSRRPPLGCGGRSVRPMRGSGRGRCGRRRVGDRGALVLSGRPGAGRGRGGCGGSRRGALGTNASQPSRRVSPRVLRRIPGVLRRGIPSMRLVGPGRGLAGMPGVLCARGQRDWSGGGRARAGVAAAAGAGDPGRGPPSCCAHGTCRGDEPRGDAGDRIATGTSAVSGLRFAARVAPSGENLATAAGVCGRAPDAGCCATTTAPPAPATRATGTATFTAAPYALPERARRAPRRTRARGENARAESAPESHAAALLHVATSALQDCGRSHDRDAKLGCDLFVAESANLAQVDRGSLRRR